MFILLNVLLNDLIIRINDGFTKVMSLKDFLLGDSLWRHCLKKPRPRDHYFQAYRYNAKGF